MLTGSLEDNVLTALVWSDTHAHSVYWQLKEAAQSIKLVEIGRRGAPDLDAWDMFSTRAYRKIARSAIDYLTQFEKPPRVHIRDLLEEEVTRGDAGKLLGMTLDAMDKLQAELQLEYVEAELTKFIKTRRLSLVIENAADALQEGELEKAEEALYAQATTTSAGSPGIWLHDANRMLAFLEQKEEDFFSSGVDVLDERNIRPARKTMFLFMAPPKRGKSWFLVEVGKRGVVHHKNVIHVTLENSEELTAERYIQALFSVTQHEAKSLRIPIFTKDQFGRGTVIEHKTIDVSAIREPATRKKIADRLRRFKTRARLLIKEFPTSSLTVAQLRAYLVSLERTEGFRPDLLILDYGDLLTLDAASLRTDTGRTFRELRGLAVERNLALVTATQGNRQSEDARVVTSKHVAEDWSKIMTADIVCAYSQTADERRLNLARILVAAARNAPDKYIVMISQSYENGQFCLDSVYMDRYLEDEVQKLTGGGKDDE